MMGIDFPKYWQALIRWKGWRLFASLCVKVWRCTVSWSGWKRIFCLTFPVLLFLSLCCAAALVWLFVQGLEQSLPAYLVYALSAYSLTALFGKVPAVVRGGRSWLLRHPKLSGLVKNKELRFRMGLYLEQALNFAYGIFKIVSGVVYGSAWIGADGIYNLAQALIQLFQILRRRKAGSLLQQWRSYRLCGMLILLMHLTLTGIVFQMVNWHRAEEQGQILVITTAAFAFYKLTKSLLDLARDRKHTHPVDSSIRMLNLAQAIFAMFSLQASMFHTFGTGESWENWMNLGTGSLACLAVAAMGVYMIRRGNRALSTLKETEHGK